MLKKFYRYNKHQRNKIFILNLQPYLIPNPTPLFFNLSTLPTSDILNHIFTLGTKFIPKQDPINS